MRWRCLPALAGIISLLPLVLSEKSLADEGEKGNKFEVQAHKDIAYYEGADAHPVKHKLDVFVPKGQKDFSVVLFVHGGVWRHGDKSFLGVYTALGSFLARNGVGAVVINYRLSPAVQHPAHVQDVARALAWTKKNIAKYGGRADQIFLCGHSAGGHLISLLVTDESYLKAEGLSSRDVKGVVSMSGVYSIPDRTFASVFGNAPGAAKKASPIEHVREGLPPFLLLFADEDFPGCDKKPAEAFCKALQDKGNKAEAIEVQDSNHYQILLSATQADDPVSRAILAFIAANTTR
jgi:acetyl esterase/lipase